MKNLKTKWGEGTGTPMSAPVDPNAPSYDPAEKFDSTTKKVMWLCEHAWDCMTKWERDFCQSVNGESPLTGKQHRRVWQIYKNHAPQAKGKK